MAKFAERRSNSQRLQSKVDRLALKMMATGLPKAQDIRRQSRIPCQRVEDNAFHLHLFAKRLLTPEFSRLTARKSNSVVTKKKTTL
jgi:hypothetical protein